MRILELYSGIGGMHYAFRESGVEGNVVAAVEINTVANYVYKHNFPQTTIMNRNIESIDLHEIQKLNVDTILMSPPCQPFTRLGLQKDTLDNRSSSLFHVLTLIPRLNTLKYILLENVKGFENSQTRDKVIECMKNCSFNYVEFILSPCQFGIPNTRHRYYLLAKKKELSTCQSNCNLMCNLPDAALTILPASIHHELAQKDDMVDPKIDRKCYRLSHILETADDENTYLISSKLLQKRYSVLDIRTANSNGSCCFTKSYGHYIEGSGSVFSPVTEKIYRHIITESEKLEKHSVEQSQLLAALKLRFFTPKEVSRLMCFPDDFGFPNNITNKQKYRLLGNSINVYVVSTLIYLLHADTII